MSFWPRSNKFSFSEGTYKVAPTILLNFMPSTTLWTLSFTSYTQSVSWYNLFDNVAYNIEYIELCMHKYASIIIVFTPYY